MPVASGDEVLRFAQDDRQSEEIMKAAVVGEKGVVIRDVAKPTPKPHEILIKVRAASRS